MAVVSVWIKHDAPVSWAFFGLFAVAAAYTMWKYEHWAGSAPNRLQTEDFQLQMQRLIGDERNPNSSALLGGAPVANTVSQSISTTAGQERQ